MDLLAGLARYQTQSLVELNTEGLKLSGVPTLICHQCTSLVVVEDEDTTMVRVRPIIRSILEMNCILIQRSSVIIK